eukprot:355717-Chlamydomonas_euryale.AAC.3
MSPHPHFQPPCAHPQTHNAEHWFPAPAHSALPIIHMHTHPQTHNTECCFPALAHSAPPIIHTHTHPQTHNTER